MYHDDGKRKKTKLVFCGADSSGTVSQKRNLNYEAAGNVEIHSYKLYLKYNLH